MSMWSRVLGLSTDKPGESSSSSKNRRDGEKPQRKRSDTTGSSRKAPQDNERDRGFNPTSTSYSSTSRSPYPGAASASVASSYATAPNNNPDAPSAPPDLVRNPSLAGQMQTSRNGRDDRDRADDRDGKSRRRRDRSDSRDQNGNRRERSRSRDKEERRRERKERKDRKRKSEGGTERGLEYPEGDYKGMSRAGEAVGGPGSFNNQIHSATFTQFPGQYDGGVPGLPVGPPRPPRPPIMSDHVPDQFPGQFPSGATAPYRPPLAVEQGGPGLAAEYYGDAGESVQTQPGVRPQAPTLIVGAQPHLMAASPIEAPPLEPSATGEVGAAASFFSGASFESPSPSPEPSQQPGRPSRRPTGPPLQTSTSGGPGSYALPTALAAGTAAIGYMASSHGEGPSGQRPPSNTISTNRPPGPPYSGGMPPNGQRPPPNPINPNFPPGPQYSGGVPPYGPPGPSPSLASTTQTYHTASAPILPTLGSAAFGAAAGYMMGSHSSHQQEPPPNPPPPSNGPSGPSGYRPPDLQRPPPHVQTSQGSYSGPPPQGPSQGSYSGYSEPSHPGKSPSASSNLPLYIAGAAGAAGLAAAAYHHEHEHQTPPQNKPQNRPTGQSYSGQSTGMAHQHRHEGPLDKLIDFFRDPEGVGRFEEYTEYIGVCRHCFEPGSSPRDAPRKHYYNRKRRSNERLGASIRVDKESRYNRLSDDESRKRNDGSWLGAGLGAGLAGYGLSKVGETLFSSGGDKKDSYSAASGRYNETTISEARRRYSNSPTQRSSTSYGIVTGSSDRRTRRSRSHSRERKSGLGLGELAAGVAVGSAILGSGSQGKHKEHESRYVPDPLERRSSMKKPKKKQKGFFNFANSSSSSIELRLTETTGSDGRRKKKGSKSRIKDHNDASAALIGLGAAAAALAAAEGRKSDRSDRDKRKAKVAAVKDMRSNENRRSDRVPIEKEKRKQTVEEQIWVDASDEDDTSSVDSMLAYGFSRRSSQESFRSDASGTDKWSWRWGGKPKEKKKGNTKTDLEAAAGIAAGAAGAALLAHEIGKDKKGGTTSQPSLQYVHPIASSDPSYFDVAGTAAGTAGAAILAHEIGKDKKGGTTSQPPLQYVHPISSSDPSYYDATTHESRQPLQTVHPAVIPLQHPQPMGPTSSVIYTSQAPYDYSYGASTGPPVYPQQPRQPLFNTGYGGSATEYYQAGPTLREKESEPRLRRRNSSPTPAVPEKVPIEPRSTKRASAVRFDVIEGMEERNRADDLQGRTKPNISQPALEAKRNRADTNEKQRKSTTASVETKDKRSMREAGIDERLQRLRRDEAAAAASKKKDNDPRITPAVAGVAGAAIGVVAAEAISKAKEPREIRKEQIYKSKDTQKSVESEQPSEVSSTQDLKRTEAEAAIAKRAAKLIRRTPSPSVPYAHEDYASFFAPEGLSKSKDSKVDSKQNHDNDILTYSVPEIITVEPAERGSTSTVQYSYKGFEDEEGFDPNLMRLPWQVPLLKLIKPTPPPSMAGSVAGSVRGDSSPIMRPEDAHVPDDDEPEKASSRVKVTFGDAETREYEVITPMEQPHEFIDPSYVHDEPRGERSQTSQETQPKSEGPESPVEEEITREDIEREEMARHRMPGSFEDDIDFAATLAAGLQDSGFDPAIVIENPTYHRRESPPGSEESGFYRRPFYETVEDLTLDSPGTEGVPPVIGFVEDGEVPPTPKDEKNSTVTEPAAEIKAAPNETSKSHSPKTGTVRTLKEDLVPLSISSQSIPKTTDDQKAVEPEIIEAVPRSLARSVGVGAGLTGIAAAVAAGALGSKHEVRDSPVSRKEAAGDSLASKEDAAAVPLPLDGSDDLDDSDDRYASRIASDDRDEYDSADDFASTAATAPITNEAQEKKKRRKSKRKSSGYNDAASVVSSPAAFDTSREANGTTKKEKRGGIFGALFSSKSTEPAPDTRRGKDKDVTRDDRDPPSRKGSKSSKDRRSKRDSGNFYNQPSEATTDLSRAEGGSRRSSGDRKDHRSGEQAGKTEGDSGTATQESKTKRFSTQDDELDFISAYDDDPGEGPSQIQQQNEPLSFLGVRREETEPPDITSVTEDPGGQSRRWSMETARRDAVDPQVRQRLGTDFDDCATLQDSPPPSPLATPTREPPSPLATPARDGHRLSMLQLSDPSHSVATPSPTAVPLMFRRFPLSAGPSRSLPTTPGASPMAPTSLTLSPRQRKDRPSSTEFKTSKEFRPLWLVEKNNVTKLKQEPEDIYPSLPSSHSTSRASSVHGVDQEEQEDYHEAFEDDLPHGAVSPSTEAAFLERIGYKPEFYRHDILDSQQATPTRGTFHFGEDDRDVDISPTHAPSTRPFDLQTQPPEGDWEELRELPALPPSRTTSPYEETSHHGTSLGMMGAAAGAAAAAATAVALEHPSHHDEESLHKGETHNIPPSEIEVRKGTNDRPTEFLQSPRSSTQTVLHEPVVSSIEDKVSAAHIPSDEDNQEYSWENPRDLPDLPPSGAASPYQQTSDYGLPPLPLSGASSPYEKPDENPATLPMLDLARGAAAASAPAVALESSFRHEAITQPGKEEHKFPQSSVEPHEKPNDNETLVRSPGSSTPKVEQESIPAIIESEGAVSHKPVLAEETPKQFWEDPAELPGLPPSRQASPYEETSHHEISLAMMGAAAGIAGVTGAALVQEPSSPHAEKLVAEEGARRVSEPAPEVKERSLAEDGRFNDSNALVRSPSFSISKVEHEAIPSVIEGEGAVSQNQTLTQDMPKHFREDPRELPVLPPSRAASPYQQTPDFNPPSLPLSGTSSPYEKPDEHPATLPILDLAAGVAAASAPVVALESSLRHEAITQPGKDECRISHSSVEAHETLDNNATLVRGPSSSTPKVEHESTPAVIEGEGAVSHKPILAEEMPKQHWEDPTELPGLPLSRPASPYEEASDHESSLAMMGVATGIAAVTGATLVQESSSPHTEKPVAEEDARTVLESAPEVNERSLADDERFNDSKALVQSPSASTSNIEHEPIPAFIEGEGAESHKPRLAQEMPEKLLEDPTGLPELPPSRPASPYEEPSPHEISSTMMGAAAGIAAVTATALVQESSAPHDQKPVAEEGARTVSESAPEVNDRSLADDERFNDSGALVRSPSSSTAEVEPEPVRAVIEGEGTVSHKPILAEEMPKQLWEAPSELPGLPPSRPASPYEEPSHHESSLTIMGAAAGIAGVTGAALVQEPLSPHDQKAVAEEGARTVSERAREVNERSIAGDERFNDSNALVRSPSSSTSKIEHEPIATVIEGEGAVSHKPILAEEMPKQVWEDPKELPELPPSRAASPYQQTPDFVLPSLPLSSTSSPYGTPDVHPTTFPMIDLAAGEPISETTDSALPSRKKSKKDMKNNKYSAIDLGGDPGKLEEQEQAEQEPPKSVGEAKLKSETIQEVNEPLVEAQEPASSTREGQNESLPAKVEEPISEATDLALPSRKKSKKDKKKSKYSAMGLGEDPEKLGEPEEPVGERQLKSESLQDVLEPLVEAQGPANSIAGAQDESLPANVEGPISEATDSSLPSRKKSKKDKKKSKYSAIGLGDDPEKLEEPERWEQEPLESVGEAQLKSETIQGANEPLVEAQEPASSTREAQGESLLANVDGPIAVPTASALPSRNKSKKDKKKSRYSAIDLGEDPEELEKQEQGEQEPLRSIGEAHLKSEIFQEVNEPLIESQEPARSTGEPQKRSLPVNDDEGISEATDSALPSRKKSKKDKKKSKYSAIDDLGEYRENAGELEQEQLEQEPLRSVGDTNLESKTIHNVVKPIVEAQKSASSIVEAQDESLPANVEEPISKATASALPSRKKGKKDKKCKYTAIDLGEDPEKVEEQEQEQQEPLDSVGDAQFEPETLHNVDEPLVEAQAPASSTREAQDESLPAIVDDSISEATDSATPSRKKSKKDKKRSKYSAIDLGEDDEKQAEQEQEQREQEPLKSVDELQLKSETIQAVNDPLNESQEPARSIGEPQKRSLSVNDDEPISELTDSALPSRKKSKKDKKKSKFSAMDHGEDPEKLEEPEQWQQEPPGSVGEAQLKSENLQEVNEPAIKPQAPASSVRSAQGEYLPASVEEPISEATDSALPLRKKSKKEKKSKYSATDLGEHPEKLEEQEQGEQGYLRSVGKTQVMSENFQEVNEPLVETQEPARSIGEAQDESLLVHVEEPISKATDSALPSRKKSKKEKKKSKYSAIDFGEEPEEQREQEQEQREQEPRKSIDEVQLEPETLKQVNEPLTEAQEPASSIREAHGEPLPANVDESISEATDSALPSRKKSKKDKKKSKYAAKDLGEDPEKQEEQGQELTERGPLKPVGAAQLDPGTLHNITKPLIEAPEHASSTWDAQGESLPSNVDEPTSEATDSALPSRKKSKKGKKKSKYSAIDFGEEPEKQEEQERELPEQEPLQSVGAAQLHPETLHNITEPLNEAQALASSTWEAQGEPLPANVDEPTSEASDSALPSRKKSKKDKKKSSKYSVIDLGEDPEKPEEQEQGEQEPLKSVDEALLKSETLQKVNEPLIESQEPARSIEEPQEESRPANVDEFISEATDSALSSRKKNKKDKKKSKYTAMDIGEDPEKVEEQKQREQEPLDSVGDAQFEPETLHIITEPLIEAQAPASPTREAQGESLSSNVDEPTSETTDSALPSRKKSKKDKKRSKDSAVDFGEEHEKQEEQELQEQEPLQSVGAAQLHPETLQNITEPLNEAQAPLSSTWEAQGEPLPANVDEPTSEATESALPSRKKSKKDKKKKSKYSTIDLGDDPEKPAEQEQGEQEPLKSVNEVLLKSETLQKVNEPLIESQEPARSIEEPQEESRPANVDESISEATDSALPSRKKIKKDKKKSKCTAMDISEDPEKQEKPEQEVWEQMPLELVGAARLDPETLQHITEPLIEAQAPASPTREAQGESLSANVDEPTSEATDSAPPSRKKSKKDKKKSKYSAIDLDEDPEKLEEQEQWEQEPLKSVDDVQLEPETFHNVNEPAVESQEPASSIREAQGASLSTNVDDPISEATESAPPSRKKPKKDKKRSKYSSLDFGEDPEKQEEQEREQREQEPLDLVGETQLKSETLDDVIEPAVEAQEPASSTVQAQDKSLSANINKSISEATDSAPPSRKKSKKDKKKSKYSAMDLGEDPEKQAELEREEWQQEPLKSVNEVQLEPETLHNVDEPAVESQEPASSIREAQSEPLPTNVDESIAETTDSALPTRKKSKKDKKRSKYSTLDLGEDPEMQEEQEQPEQEPRKPADEMQLEPETVRNVNEPLIEAQEPARSIGEAQDESFPASVDEPVFEATNSALPSRKKSKKDKKKSKYSVMDIGEDPEKLDEHERERERWGQEPLEPVGEAQRNFEALQEVNEPVVEPQEPASSTWEAQGESLPANVDDPIFETTDSTFPSRKKSKKDMEKSKYSVMDMGEDPEKLEETEQWQQEPLGSVGKAQLNSETIQEVNEPLVGSQEPASSTREAQGESLLANLDDPTSETTDSARPSRKKSKKDKKKSKYSAMDLGEDPEKLEEQEKWGQEPLTSVGETQTKPQTFQEVNEPHVEAQEPASSTRKVQGESLLANLDDPTSETTDSARLLRKKSKKDKKKSKYSAIDLGEDPETQEEQEPELREQEPLKSVDEGQLEPETLHNSNEPAVESQEPASSMREAKREFLLANVDEPVSEATDSALPSRKKGKYSVMDIGENPEKQEKQEPELREQEPLKSIDEVQLASETFHNVNKPAVESQEPASSIREAQGESLLANVDEPFSEVTDSGLLSRMKSGRDKKQSKYSAIDLGEDPEKLEEPERWDQTPLESVGETQPKSETLQGVIEPLGEAKESAISIPKTQDESLPANAEKSISETTNSALLSRKKSKYLVMDIGGDPEKLEEQQQWEHEPLRSVGETHLKSETLQEDNEPLVEAQEPASSTREAQGESLLANIDEPVFETTDSALPLRKKSKKDKSKYTAIAFGEGPKEQEEQEQWKEEPLRSVGGAHLKSETLQEVNEPLVEAQKPASSTREAQGESPPADIDELTSEATDSALPSRKKTKKDKKRSRYSALGLGEDPEKLEEPEKGEHEPLRSVGEAQLKPATLHNVNEPAVESHESASSIREAQGESLPTNVDEPISEVTDSALPSRKKSKKENKRSRYSAMDLGETPEKQEDQGQEQWEQELLESVGEAKLKSETIQEVFEPLVEAQEPASSMRETHGESLLANIDEPVSEATDSALPSRKKTKKDKKKSKYTAIDFGEGPKEQEEQGQEQGKEEPLRSVGGAQLKSGTLQEVNEPLVEAQEPASSTREAQGESLLANIDEPVFETTDSALPLKKDKKRSKYTTVDFGEGPEEQEEQWREEPLRSVGKAQLESETLQEVNQPPVEAQKRASSTRASPDRERNASPMAVEERSSIAGEKQARAKISRKPVNVPEQVQAGTSSQSEQQRAMERAAAKASAVAAGVALFETLHQRTSVPETEQVKRQGPAKKGAPVYPDRGFASFKQTNIPFEGPQDPGIPEHMSVRDVNRDSAVHVSDSPLPGEPTPSYHSIRDSGYQGTEASPMFQERVEGGVSQKDTRLSMDSFDIINRSSLENPLNISIEVDPTYNVSISRPEYDGTRNVTEVHDPESGEQLPVQYQEPPSSPAVTHHGERRPSPVESETKPRSSELFQSSPSTRDNMMNSPLYRQSSPSLGGTEHHQGHTISRNIDNYTSPTRKPVHSVSIQTTQEPGSSLFGSPVNISTDTHGLVSPPRTPLSSTRRQLDPIDELGSEQLPAHKHYRAASDVGLPEHAFKTQRRSLTPHDINQPRVRSPLAETSRDIGPISMDEIDSRLSWPAVDDEAHHVDLERSKSRNTDSSRRSSGQHPPLPALAGAALVGTVLASDVVKHHETDFRSVSGASVRSNESISAIIKDAESRSPGTPPLRRVDRSVSSDLRAANKRSEAKKLAKSAETREIDLEPPIIASSSTYDPVNDKGKGRIVKMTDVFEGWGDVNDSPRSPTRPASMRKRQSMQFIEMQTRLEQLASENRSLVDAKTRAERDLEQTVQNREELKDALTNAIQSRDQYLKAKDEELNELRRVVEELHNQVSHLTEVNETLQGSSRDITADHEERYAQLQDEHANVHQSWQETTRELEDLKTKHTSLSGGMEGIVRHEVELALSAKNAELRQMRSELESAKEQVRTLQAQILASRGSDDVLIVRDEDYFDNACQSLCQHVQQWVLRFSKFSDSKICHSINDIADEKIVDRFDNAILDGSDVDIYLKDRIKRRDVFMSVVMTMVWEYVFTRYLFGMDREQRQKLKSLEKTLSEVGPQRAVNKWRATTLTMLSKREVFQNQRDNDTEAVVQEIYDTLATLLTPPAHLVQPCIDSLRKVLSTAIDLAIEMRTQRAEYIMLPPLQPEFDTTGELARKVNFNASLMNERSGDTTSNEELEARQAVVRMVLFPLVVKKGDDEGVGDEEIVVCPAQVLVARDDDRRSGKKSVRVVSAQGGGGDPMQSVQSFAPTDATMGRPF